MHNVSASQSTVEISASKMEIFDLRYFMASKPENEILKLLQSGNREDIVKDDTAIIIALFLRYFRVAVYLFSRGARIHHSSDFMQIVFSGNIKCLETAINCLGKNTFDRYFYPREVDWDTIPNIISVCEILLKHGFDPNHPFKTNSPPLIYPAILAGKEDIIDKMLKYGANPCTEFLYKGTYRTPLKEAFHLAVPTIQKIIKYAALFLNSRFKLKVEAFFNHFRKDKSRSFNKFARRCYAESGILKELSLTCDGKATMHSFLMSRGKSLELLLKDTSVKNNIFSILVSTPLPIYKPLIANKLTRKIILTVLNVLEHRWGPSSSDISLNFLCVDNILKYLTNEDLINLWISIN